MSAPDATPGTSEASRADGANLALPPVTPPTATFLLQLFLIPLLIVSVVVLLWLLFGWVAHMGRDNASELVRGIERGDNGSGQLAFELAGLLRSPDPKYDAVRNDAELAQRLAAFLDRDLADVLTKADETRIMRRMYLCRVIGEFHVPAGLPVLLKAAREERNPADVDIRLSALEAMATLAANCGSETLQTDAVFDVLLDASRSSDNDSAPAANAATGTASFYRPHGELRTVAAYTLGVIAGEQASARLREMLHDPYPSARYNAATGLARHGDASCIGVLREMLDPANPLAVQDEGNPNDRARKRTTVLLNGIRATVQLARSNPSADLSALREALQSLTSSSLETVTIDRSRIKSAAAEALRILNEPKLGSR